MARAVNSGSQKQCHTDAAFNWCDKELALVGFGMNRMKIFSETLRKLKIFSENLRKTKIVLKKFRKTQKFGKNVLSFILCFRLSMCNL